MTVDRVQRRMAAILAADVVGYSRLMGTDEEATLATLKCYRKVIDDLITHHGGRIFGSAGDSIIAEFASPVEAVRCATETQIEIDKRNTDLPEARRMRFRIGINLGDVVVDGDNLMGDGVNVAARLEALASPGGMCISESIHTHVRDRLSLDFLDLGEHIVKNIARPVHAYRVPLASEERVKSPFRGLDTFDFDHAHLFFGRARAIATCVERLEQLTANGKAFLLIYGMSGSGKSSLLRAGLLPQITRPGMVAGITFWRRCVIRPSEAPDAIASFVAGLLRALPELVQEHTPAELVSLFGSKHDRGLASIRAALWKAATDAGAFPSQARLILAVDQIEELFTTQPTSRESLVRILATLAGSGLAWVVGTIRADFFHRCSEIPGFSALKDGLGSYELLPPTGPEIAQIIREPARAAGLRFEETADQGRLEDVLQEAAAADPGSLPLLEFVLDELYEAGQERRMLSFAAYRALGGLEGAIARRADEVVDALAPEIQDALPAVLRALITVRLGDEAIAASPAYLDEVAGSPTQAALVNALIAARLLTSDEDAQGHAVTRVAHEALLTRWPRARDIVNANREFLETRTRIQTDERRWHSDRKNPELLLPAGKRLAEAEELLLARRDEVDDRIVAYIEASSIAQKAVAERDRQAERALIEAAEAAKRERLEREAERLEGEAHRRSLAAAAATRLARRTRYAALIALVLALAAGGGAFVGLKGQQEARRQAALAEQSANQAKEAEKLARAAEEQAIAARDDALRNQSLSLSFLSQQTATSGDTEAAILLALEALPKNRSVPDRPYLFEAEAALYKALLAHRQTMIFHHDAGVTDATFNPAGDRLVTSSFDKTARVWNVANGSQVAALKGHEGVVERAMFSPDGRHVVTASRDGTARIWDAASGQQIFILQQPGEVHTALFSPDGTRVLTGSELSDPVLWDAKTGAQIAKVQSPTNQSVAFSPDGRSFATNQGYLGMTKLWDTQDGKLIQSFNNGVWTGRVVFSPDGTHLLVTAWGSSSHLWNVLSKTEISILRGHKSEIVGGAFSHDGRFIATCSLDGAARLWDAVTGHLHRVLGEETAGLLVVNRDQELNCAFSSNDHYLATASMHGKVYIWNVENGAKLAVIEGKGDLVEHVEFSPAGNTLLTASHDGTARLWDIDGVLTTMLSHKYPPTFAVFSPDNAHVLTGGGDAVAHLWDVAGGRELAALETQVPVQSAAFSPDGHLVATSSLEGQILIWDLASRREVARLKSRDGLTHIQFSPDGELLESGSINGTAQLWDAANGAELAVLKTSADFPYAVFNPDGHLVLTARNDNTARLLKTDGTELRVLAGHQNRISAATFSPDGRLAVTGSLDHTARIWSINDGSTVATLKGHSDALTEVAFSPDGQSVVTASRDGTARIWSVSNGKEKVVLRGHSGRVKSAQFSSNGLYVVTASSQDRTVRLWAAESGREIAILAGRPELRGPLVTGAAFNSDGTGIVIVSGEERVRIVRTFQTPQNLIEYAKTIVPRELTPCERRRFFLPVEGDVGVCSN